MIMENTETAEIALQELNNIGIRLSVDDFGTGYSSLGCLKRFPIHTLKIDKSFIHDLTLQSDDAAIVAAIISMAGKLSLSVVAEGVETMEQADLLAQLVCTEVQGYYYSRPLPAAAFTKLLLEQKTTN